ncbi:MBL fold metallo-hydrolase [Haoranjiania flava]|uniref:MBL fold metallo-hydrolase n=1 Tax=Haoranjiania flava TaxID=1856322 RepID=A0AAE3IN62_9BACT|nr:MBL fold metallo-hydrolase [Haoranjiania flava]MCU7695095.1 MBL fold metallo-hydrolase [Haoranjiania flava]
MHITFHGAARTVTGSKHLITLKNGYKILLDCGLFQGMGKETFALNENFGFNAADIDVLILSHAHIDHSGLIPKLVGDGFTGKIYCTPATVDLAKILLEDSAGIQESDTEFVNKRRAKEGLPPYEPLYTVADARSVCPLFVETPYNHWMQINDDVKLLFTDAGHIIGSACVHLAIREEGKEQRISFSGDIGRYKDVILKSPEVFPQADYLIMESTYGDSLHEGVFDTAETLLYWVTKTCMEKKGKLIIPAFSVGRTQELLYFLNQLSLERSLPKVPVYVDSPLSYEATQVVKSHPQNFNNRLKKILQYDHDPFDFDNLLFIGSVEESKALNADRRPMVIISASGMADAGRVKHHIMNNISDERNSILIVGYCEPNSLGGRLMNGQKQVRIFREEFDVVAEVGVMRSMSAHGDYDDLCQFLACQNPAEIKSLFLVHGEYDVQLHFREKLMKKGYREVIIPEQHERIHLQ